MSKMRTAIRYYIGKSVMRDGCIRVSVYPKRPEVMTRVFEALKAAGYVEADKAAYERMRKSVHQKLSKVRHL